MLTLHPIGYVRTGKQVKFDALHQPDESAGERHVLELVPGCHYEEGLKDLEGFTRIWLIWWFHRNTTWRPMVLPPRGPAIRRGVFATRSPHRPNPLGMTPVQLLAVEKHRLVLGPCDLMEGTPVFDIKPYLPSYDAFPEESAGWTGAVDHAAEAPPAFTVEYAPLATAHAEWLKEHWHIDFRGRLEELLTRDPTPHRTRRIRHNSATGTSTISCGAWRARFHVVDRTVHLHALEPGFPLRFLTRGGREAVPDGAAQLAFLQQWGGTPSDSP